MFFMDDIRKALWQSYYKWKKNVYIYNNQVMDFDFDEEIQTQLRQAEQVMAKKKQPKVIKGKYAHFDSANYELEKKHKKPLGETQEKAQIDAK